MLDQIKPAIKATIIIATLTGIIFPLMVTAIANIFFPAQANGLLIKNGAGQIIGSKLIGQQFNNTNGRPSAAGSGYAGEASAGTNLGPTSAKLINGQSDNPATKDVDESFAGIKQLNEQYRLENLLIASEKTPVDAVTRSGSGLDPDISLNNAFFQARRISKVRGLSLQQVLDLVHLHTQTRQLGILGEPRVNVLMLNLALDKLKS
jgi:K+-transporting ATPase ATPase C chain